jgi:hypothetical protein
MYHPRFDHLIISYSLELDQFLDRCTVHPVSQRYKLYVVIRETDMFIHPIASVLGVWLEILMKRERRHSLARNAMK